MLMFYSKVFDVSRRPKFHVPVVLSICLVCPWCACVWTSEQNYDRITGIERKPKTTAKNTLSHTRYTRRTHKNTSWNSRSKENDKHFHWQLQPHTTIQNYLCALSNAKAMRSLFSRLSSFFHSHFTSSSSSSSHPLRFSLSRRLLSFMSVVFIVARCYFLCVFRIYSLWFSDEWRVGRGGKNSVIFYSICQSIEWCVCCERGRKREKKSFMDNVVVKLNIVDVWVCVVGMYVR